MIEELREYYKLTELLSAFNIARSSYAYRDQRARCINREKERLKAKVIAIHRASRGSAGARRVSSALKQSGESVGRRKAGTLLKAAGLKSKQPSKRRRPQKLSKEAVIAPKIMP